MPGQEKTVFASPGLFFSRCAENREHGHGSLCLPNDILLSLFHSSLELELSDKEIPLATGDHGAFMHHILGRERDGHGAPFSLPLIKGQRLNPLAQGSRSQSIEILSLGRPRCEDSKQGAREEKKYQTRLYVFMFKYSENKCEIQIFVSVGSETMGCT